MSRLADWKAGVGKAGTAEQILTSPDIVFSQSPDNVFSPRNANFSMAPDSNNLIRKNATIDIEPITPVNALVRGSGSAPSPKASSPIAAISARVARSSVSYTSEDPMSEELARQEAEMDQRLEKARVAAALQQGEASTRPSRSPPAGANHDTAAKATAEAKRLKEEAARSRAEYQAQQLKDAALRSRAEYQREQHKMEQKRRAAVGSPRRSGGSEHVDAGSWPRRTSVPEESARHVCNAPNCDNSASGQCKRCKQVYYCCKEHQVEDWKAHEAVCYASAKKRSPSEQEDLERAAAAATAEAKRLTDEVARVAQERKMEKKRRAAGRRSEDFEQADLGSPRRTTREDQARHVCNATHCDNSASGQCKRCKTVYYCCKEHQVEDWKAHEEVCNASAKKRSQSWSAASQTESDESARAVHEAARAALTEQQRVQLAERKMEKKRRAANAARSKSVEFEHANNPAEPTLSPRRSATEPGLSSGSLPGLSPRRPAAESLRQQDAGAEAARAAEAAATAEAVRVRLVERKMEKKRRAAAASRRQSEEFGRADADNGAEGIRNIDEAESGSPRLTSPTSFRSTRRTTETERQEQFFTASDTEEITMACVPFPSKRWLDAEVEKSGSSKALRNLARRWHPDSFSNKFGNRLCEADKTEIMGSVTEVFQMLSELVRETRESECLSSY